MNKFTKYRKLVKYRVLRHTPGTGGHRYRRKYSKISAIVEFDNALRNSKGKICVDLGANLGEYTRKMASVAKLVIAFEPDPWTLKLLQENVTHLDNVRIENAAAGVKEAIVLLYRHEKFEQNPASRSQSSTVLSCADYLNTEEGIEVSQIDFIKYLEDIGLLKIDIEGAEVDILESLLDRPDILNRIDYIFAETHEKWIPMHEPRVKALRERAGRIERPYINLDWV